MTPDFPGTKDREMKRWMVETRAIVRRTYFVCAYNPKEAEEASCNAQPDLDEDESEETMTISEVPTDDVALPTASAENADAR